MPSVRPQLVAENSSTGAGQPTTDQNSTAATIAAATDWLSDADVGAMTTATKLSLTIGRTRTVGMVILVRVPVPLRRTPCPLRRQWGRRAAFLWLANLPTRISDPGRPVSSSGLPVPVIDEKHIPGPIVVNIYCPCLQYCQSQRFFHFRSWLQLWQP